MSNRKELIEAMNIIRENCGSVRPSFENEPSCTERCEIGELCNGYFNEWVNPQNWDLEESETE